MRRLLDTGDLKIHTRVQEMAKVVYSTPFMKSRNSATQNTAVNNANANEHDVELNNSSIK